MTGSSSCRSGTSSSVSQRSKARPETAGSPSSAAASGEETGSASAGESPGGASVQERQVAVFEIQEAPQPATRRSGGDLGALASDEVKLRLCDGVEGSAPVGAPAADAAAEEPARAGGWQHASAHTVAAVFGAGVLSLPYAVRWLGLAWGMALLSAACAVSYYSSYLLAVLGSDEAQAGGGDKIKAQHPPPRSYRELGQRVFGDRAGLWAIAPFQFTVLVGTTLVYLTLGGESLSSIYTTACAQPRSAGDGAGACPPFPQWAWTVVFTCCCLLVAPRPGIHEVSWVSFLAAAMSITYGTMAVVTSALDLAGGGGSDATGAPCDHADPSAGAGPSPVLESFNAIGIILFSYGGHSVLPEIQATIRPNPTTVRPMMRGVSAAYLPTTAIYFSLAAIGFLAYGECTHPNVLLSDSGSDPAARKIAAAADFLVAVHVFGSIQLYSQPVMQALRRAAAAALDARGGRAPSPTALRYGVNLTYVASLGVLATLLPDASAVIGLIGGLAITWMTFVVPSIMFIAARRGRCSRAALAVNALIIAGCTTLGLLATVGAGYRLSEHFFTQKASQQ